MSGHGEQLITILFIIALNVFEYLQSIAKGWVLSMQQLDI